MKITKQILLMAFTMMIILTSTFDCYASEIPLDGNYKVELTFTGGTGRVTAISPTDLTVSNGKMTAKITLTSSNYTYMIVDGNYYYNTAAVGENSTFIIPISALDSEIEITACTEAMSSPKEIDYIIKVSSEGTVSNKDKATSENTEKNANQNTNKKVVDKKNDKKSDKKNNTSNDANDDVTNEISKDTESKKSNGTSNITDNDNKVEEKKTGNITVEDTEKETLENNADEVIDDSSKVQESSSKSILNSNKVIIIFIVILAAAVIGIVFKKRKQ